MTQLDRVRKTMSEWPAIEAHVEETRKRVGHPPIYVLKLGTDPLDAHQVFMEVQRKYPGHPMGQVGREIRVWGCD